MVETEELVNHAKRMRVSWPNVEMFSAAAIYRMIKEHHSLSLNLAEFKEFIYHLTGWDIPLQVIRSQLEINEILV